MLLKAFSSPLLILGPAHAGKSELAIGCLSPERKTLVIATAAALDPIMTQRVQKLQAMRPPHWQTLESSSDISGTFAAQAQSVEQVLIDSINLWLAAAFVRELKSRDEGAAIEALLHQVDELASLLGQMTNTRTVLVSNEIGAALPTANSAERSLRRLVGTAHQKLAAASASVMQVTAGIPMVLKGER